MVKKRVHAASDTRVNIRANTDVTGTGVIGALTNGDINLTEVAGDLRSDVITSTAHDVTLTSTGAGGRILSGQLSAVAGNLSMTAAAAIEDWLPEPGFVPAATAHGNITMLGNAGGINVRTITSTNGNLTLTAVVVFVMTMTVRRLYPRDADVLTTEAVVGAQTSVEDVHVEGP